MKPDNEERKDDKPKFAVRKICALIDKIETGNLKEKKLKTFGCY